MTIISFSTTYKMFKKLLEFQQNYNVIPISHYASFEYLSYEYFTLFMIMDLKDVKIQIFFDL